MLLAAASGNVAVQFDAQVGDAPVGDTLDLVSALDRTSYRRVLFGEGPQDVFSVVAASSQCTTRVELATNVAIAFARTPMSVAYSAATLQSLSDGRFVLGLGTQVRGHVTRRFSMPWSSPADRMREFVDALRAIWWAWRSAEPLQFEGDFYTHTLMPPAFVPDLHRSDPKILLAGVGPRMTELAGDVGDGYVSHPFHTAASIATMTVPALERGLAASGRVRDDIEITCCLIGADSSSDASVEAARAQLAFYGSTPAYGPVLRAEGRPDLHERLHSLSRQGRWLDMTALVDDDLLESVCVLGTPAAIGAEAERRATGWADRVVVMPPWAGDAGTDVAAVLEWYQRLAAVAN